MWERYLAGPHAGRNQDRGAPRAPSTHIVVNLSFSQLHLSGGDDCLTLGTMC